MVKNKKGGSGHKKLARKNVKPAFVSRKLRKPEDPLEIYGRITAVHGGGYADVYCQDKKTRLLVIRGKFKGRNKRGNIITHNSIVLVALRDWEVVHPKKKQKVDLLYVYNENNLEELKKRSDVQNILSDNQKLIDDTDSPFEITYKEDNHEEEVIISSKVNKKIENIKNDVTDDFNGIDFDDI
tara:strand:- start:429 stop:977 length:549 start_codon:yes stop_codon:yes gene_type:complete